MELRDPKNGSKALHVSAKYPFFSVVVEFLSIVMELSVFLYRFLIMLMIYPVKLYVAVVSTGLSSKLYQRQFLSQQIWSKP